jgi:hypothetical protein
LLVTARLLSFSGCRRAGDILLIPVMKDRLCEGDHLAHDAGHVLYRLTVLDISRSSVMELPEALGQLTALQRLCITEDLDAIAFETTVRI